jgi:hypothetical protein
MEKIHDELDHQEIHARRLARRVDALKPPGSNVELTVSRLLHARLKEVHSAWGDDAPPGWPDPNTLMVARVGGQREAIELLASQVENLGGGPLEDEISRHLKQGRERMPFALEGKFHETPLLVPPDVLTRDFYELVFHPQQEALLKIDAALDELERRSRGSTKPG